MGALDRFFGWVAGRSAAQQTAWLQTAIDGALRQMDVSRTPPWTASWETTTPGVNQDAYESLPTARARSRNLARNNEYARRFLTMLKTNVLGQTGLRLQMRMTKRGGEPYQDINDRVESAWYAWGKRGSCEVTGKLCWRDVERVLLEQLARDGEILLQKLRGVGPCGFQLQLIDPAQLDVLLNKALPGGRRITMGVELTAEGRPVAYWLTNRGKPDLDPYFSAADSYDHVRLPAEDVLHLFIAEEPNQVRGVPWLSIAARRLWLVRDYEQAAAVASINASKRVGFFVSPEGTAPPGFADQIISSVLKQAEAVGKVLTVEEVKALRDVAEKYATTNPGQYDTLPAGYDFKPHESEYPHTNYADYVKACVRGAASGLGVSYVTLGNDLESVNYSSARVGILDEREFYKALQAWFCEALHDQVFAEWLPMGMLSMPVMATLDPGRKGQYIDAATWQPRRWAGIDPLKEAEANRVNLELKLTSRRRLIIERGEDPDEVMDEIEREDERFGPASASPAAVEPDGNDTNAKPKRQLRAVTGA